jgi:hypothetical protein
MPNAWIIKLKQCAKEYQSTKPTKSKTTKKVTPKKVENTKGKIFSSVGTLPNGMKTDEFPLFKMVWEQLGYQVKRKR